MKILVAADSFKDALPAQAVCQALAAGIRRAKPQAQITCCPLADGGEGTLDVLSAHFGLQSIEINASDPLFQPIQSTYFISQDGQTAFIEMARTAGLQLVPAHKRSATATTTIGTGQQIADAKRRGAKKLILAIGGSATNDAGIGMATALGWQFLDKNGQQLQPTGGNLIKIEQIIPPVYPFEMDVEVICDVQNPLFGNTGAAHVFARQKGASDADIELLDAGLRQIIAQLEKQGIDYPSPFTAGSGAGGGMGFGTLFFLGATLRPGVDLLMDLINFEEKLSQATLLVSGEGKIDGQTTHGKLLQGLCRRAAKYEVPVVAFCGRLEASQDQIREIGLTNAVCINTDFSAPLAELLAATAVHLERAAFEFFV
jgi:glycerate kinase